MACILFLLLLPSISHALPAGRLSLREPAVCGGDATLGACGSPFPSDFCCPLDTTTCTAVNETSFTSVICCPAGQDCSRIAPITCDVTLQNAALFPSSPIHTINLTEPLPTCGDACCPFGYQCQNNACAALDAITESTTPSTKAQSSLTPTAAGLTTSIPSLPSEHQPSFLSNQSSVRPDLSPGRLFVAGFIPGILLGAAMVALVLWWLSRRSTGQRNWGSLFSKQIRPAHHRQISGPIAQPDLGERTLFRSEPKQYLFDRAPTYECSARGPETPSSLQRYKVASLFHRSSKSSTNTFSAMPTPKFSLLSPSLRRGSIAPLRKLRTKPIGSSLPRQVLSSRSSSSHGSIAPSEGNQPRPQLVDSSSRESIQVRTFPPRPTHESSDNRTKPLFPPATAKIGEAESRLWLSYGLPDRPAPVMTGPRRMPGMLDTPSRASGRVGRNPPAVRNSHNVNRDTTFTSLMERAGIRQSDLLGRAK